MATPRLNKTTMTGFLQKIITYRKDFRCQPIKREISDSEGLGDVALATAMAKNEQNLHKMAITSVGC